MQILWRLPKENERHGFILESVFTVDSLVCTAYPFVANHRTSKDESTARGWLVLSSYGSEELAQGRLILRRFKKKKKKKDGTMRINNSRLAYSLGRKDICRSKR